MESRIAALESRGAIVRKAKSGKLHTLDLQAVADFDDRVLADIGRITDLRRLELAGCPVTDEGLASLTPLKHLQHLDLQRTQITDCSLAVLRQLPQLKILLLTGCGISREGLSDLRKSMIGTRIVFL